MSLISEHIEIAAVINRLLDNLSATNSSQTGREGVALRNQIGDVRANYDRMLRDDTFTTELLACFTAAREANVKLASLAVVHQRLFEEKPVGPISISIIQAATVFCLAAESRMITDITFVSRDDVEVMIKKMKLAFDTARELAADALDTTCYQKLTALAGALTNHLSTVARPLPRMIAFKLPVSLPALALSQRVYYDPSRWEEIIDENKTIHPAFVRREIRGLSA